MNHRKLEDGRKMAFDMDGRHAPWTLHSSSSRRICVTPMSLIAIPSNFGDRYFLMWDSFVR